MDYCYYIIPDAFTTTKGDLNVGERIFAVPTNHPIIVLNDGEGPFFNLEILKQTSELYAKLKKNNPRRAHKIVQNEYINKIENYLLTPKGTTFDPKVIDVWQHIVRGEQDSNGISGVHFYDKRFVKIINILDQNEKGVISARVEVRIDENDSWVLRNEPTTLFPINWPIQQLSIELDFAFKNKVKEQGGQNRYKGKTYNGIDVIFIIVKEKVKTAYPII